MGTWGTAISSNDTYADIYNEFFDRYNNGLDVQEISSNLISTNSTTINDPDDSNNFWFALAKAQWDCKQLNPIVFLKVKSIILDNVDLEVWHGLGADQKDIRKRKIALDKFLTELSEERPKAKSRKKIIVRSPVFDKGDCLTFKLYNDNYGGAIVLEAIYNTPYPYNLVATTDINQIAKPSVNNFLESSVLVKNFASWKDDLSITWILPIRYKLVKHLFEKVGNLKVELNYDKKAIEYGSMGDFDLAIIDGANRQFKHELEGSKSNIKISIKKLIKKSNWKLW